jgi:hypothetical protein
LTREPSFDELIGAEMSDAERERLRRAHELLLQAGPPPELPPQLRKAPGFGVTRMPERRVVKRRALLLLAATLSVAAVFAAGYAVADHRGGSTSRHTTPPVVLSLKGTSEAPNARATLEVWHSRAGNWPMTLNVIGLQKLPPHTYYEVYLVRNGRPWGQCGAFRVDGSSRALTLTLNAPYKLRKGDTWVVTRPGPGGSEPGKTVLRPIAA